MHSGSFIRLLFIVVFSLVSLLLGDYFLDRCQEARFLTNNALTSSDAILFAREEVRCRVLFAFCSGIGFGLVVLTAFWNKINEGGFCVFRLLCWSMVLFVFCFCYCYDFSLLGHRDDLSFLVVLLIASSLMIVLLFLRGKGPVLEIEDEEDPLV